MAQTSNQQIPYPGVNDAPDGPYGFQQMAEKIDTALTAHDGKFGRLPYKIVTGSGTLSVGSANTTISSFVSFGTSTFDSAPIVLISPTTNAAKASVYSAYSATTGGFTAKVQTADGSTYGASFVLGFSWVAIQILAP